MVPALVRRFKRLLRFFVDGGYHSAPLAKEIQALDPQRGIHWDVVRRNQKPEGFTVLPKRWLVERTFGWLSHSRRLVKDYETRLDSSEAMIYLCSARILLRRLA